MRNKWLIGGLVLSLVVNLALAGFVAGRLTRDFAPLPGLDPMVGVGRLVRFLDDDRRREVAADFRSKRREFRKTARAIRAAQREVSAAVAREPFDEAALRAALADFRERLEGAHADSHEMFVTMAARLTPEERRHLARAVARPGHHRGGHRDGHRDSHLDGPPPR